MQATTTESRASGACAPQQATTTESRASGACAPQQTKPLQWNAQGPQGRGARTQRNERKPMQSDEDPAPPGNK